MMYDAKFKEHTWHADPRMSDSERQLSCQARACGGEPSCGDREELREGLLPHGSHGLQSPCRCRSAAVDRHLI